MSFCVNTDCGNTASTGYKHCYDCFRAFKQKKSQETANGPPCISPNCDGVCRPDKEYCYRCFKAYLKELNADDEESYAEAKQNWTPTECKADTCPNMSKGSNGFCGDCHRNMKFKQRVLCHGEGCTNYQRMDWCKRCYKMQRMQKTFGTEVMEDIDDDNNLWTTVGM